MALQEIAQAARLAEFTAQMPDGLARGDQRAAGGLYVRGLLTGGRRKPMVSMAARPGTER